MQGTAIPNVPGILEQLGPQRSKALYETWAPFIGAVNADRRERKVPKLDDEKALSLAIVLENTRGAFERASHSGILHETTQVGDVGAFKLQYFDIITAVFPNMISQDIVSVQPLTQKVGQIFYLKYLFGSTKGTITKGDTMNEPLFGETVAPGHIYYSSEFIDEEAIGDDGETDFTGNLAWTPVRPGTVTITIGADTVTDDGVGNLVSDNGALLSGSSGENTVDYSSGLYSLNLASAAGDAVVVSYEYNNEFAPAQVPQVDISIAQTTLTARSRKLKALYAMDAGYDLKMQHGLDIDEALLSAVSAEIMHELDGEILKNLYDGAYNTSTWDKTPPSVYQPWVVHRETFIDELITASNKIYTATQRATGNFIIVGVNVATVLESIGAPRFVSSGAAANGPYYAGMLDGKWKVYKDPYYDPDAYLVGYKGDLFLDAGFVLAPYMPLFTTQLLLGEDFLGRRGFATSNAKKMVNSRMYVKGTMTSSDPHWSAP